MRIAVISVPYHLGHERVGMGRGPDALVDAGLVTALERNGHDIELVLVDRPEDTANEIAASFDVIRGVAKRVGQAVEAGAFPLVLSGNCMSCLGTVAGLGEEVGVVWFDAHPDFNTTEHSLSGFADGMGLSILTGTGWRALRETITGYRPVPEANVVLVGIRDIDPPEQERLDASPAATVPPDELDELSRRLDALKARVDELYLHLDLDVLDPSEGLANEYAAPGGLTADEVASAVGAIGERFRVRAAAVTAYDPAFDHGGAVAETALGLLARIVETGVPLPQVART